MVPGTVKLAPPRCSTWSQQETFGGRRRFALDKDRGAILMQAYDVRALFSFADRASRLNGSDSWLDRDICLSLRYLDGRMFADWLVVLPDHRLSSADGSHCGEPDPLTASIDAVEKLRRCLLPRSRLSVRMLDGGLEQYQCQVRFGPGVGEAGSTSVANSEACARLAALLYAFASSTLGWPNAAGEPARLRFALVDK
ncbi:hypothetical protein J8I29_13255 [Labrys sp. LIt4]|uniref:hypothetical protein n=1 Tax=Labrys sp. LIt4 TaxID=2821355 RepID=UPI001AE0A7C3|nr:hypothetical protein [Labrys sp. LIt4]MBP0580285.1 hypothetical protein [Labrys sp. LIt4]